MFVLLLQRMLIELVLDIFYFPIWWYSEGARKALFFCVSIIKSVNGMLSPGLWLKNIFVPMFGQSDFQGRLVSIFIRFLNVIFRTIGLLIWVMLVVVIFFVWILFPMFILYFLVDSIISLLQSKG